MQWISHSFKQSINQSITQSLPRAIGRFESVRHSPEHELVRRHPTVQVRGSHLLQPLTCCHGDGILTNQNQAVRAIMNVDKQSRTLKLWLTTYSNRLCCMPLSLSLSLEHVSTLSRCSHADRSINQSINQSFNISCIEIYQSNQWRVGYMYKHCDCQANIYIYIYTLSHNDDVIGSRHLWGRAGSQTHLPRIYYTAEWLGLGVVNHVEDLVSIISCGPSRVHQQQNSCEIVVISNHLA